MRNVSQPADPKGPQGHCKLDEEGGQDAHRRDGDGPQRPHHVPAGGQGAVGQGQAQAGDGDGQVAQHLVEQGVWGTQRGREGR